MSVTSVSMQNVEAASLNNWLAGIPVMKDISSLLSFPFFFNLIAISICFFASPSSLPLEGRRLSESLEVPKNLEDVFNDFKAPIYDIREIESERCQSEELRDLVDLLQKIYERDFHFEEREYNKQACIVAFSITGDKELLEIANRKEGKIKMCEAIRELRYEERMKGINEGEIKGREEGEAKKQFVFNKDTSSFSCLNHKSCNSI